MLRPGTGGTLKASLDQSTVHSVPLPLARLRRREASYRAALGTDGEIDGFVLAQMDGEITLEEIAERLLERFPDHDGTSDAKRPSGGWPGCLSSTVAESR